MMFIGMVYVVVTQAELAYNQRSKKRTVSGKTPLIGEFSTDVIDELGLKLDTAVFEQQLAREEGLNQPQRFVFVKEGVKSVEGNKSKSARKKSVSKESSKKQ